MLVIAVEEVGDDNRNIEWLKMMTTIIRLRVATAAAAAAAHLNDVDILFNFLKLLRTRLAAKCGFRMKKDNFDDKTYGLN